MTVSEPIGHVERPVCALSLSAHRHRRWGRQAGLADGLMGIALLAGPANVIMQLARPGVGYGVVESRVESGRIDLVAAEGSEDQKAAFRRAVNRAQAQVYPTEDSPLSYNVFDPDLQMWVGACLYKNAVDVYRMFVGEMDDETAEQHYLEGMALGTTLQVPPEMWPPNRKAFDDYWRSSLEKTHIDDTVREYLSPIAAARVALPIPRWMRTPMERIALMITTGFL
jgi:uncharacterized protein (DUF2236 family)